MGRILMARALGVNSKKQFIIQLASFNATC